MFNFDGQIFAGVLTDQQLGQTFNEILQTRRDAGATNGPTEQDYVNLLNAYNQLLSRFNRVIESDKTENEKNRQTDADHADTVAASNLRIAALEKENGDLQWDLAGAKANEEWFRASLNIAERKLRDAGLAD